MLPATDNITAYRGDTLRLRRYLEDPDGERYDLTGCIPTAQIRTKKNAAEVLYAFECELTDQVTDPGGIVMEIAAGVTNDAPSTTAWDFQLEFGAGGDVRTYGAGSCKFSGQVTRPVA